MFISLFAIKIHVAHTNSINSHHATKHHRLTSSRALQTTTHPSSKCTAFHLSCIATPIYFSPCIYVITHFQAMHYSFISIFILYACNYISLYSLLHLVLFFMHCQRLLQTSTLTNTLCPCCLVHTQHMHTSSMYAPHHVHGTSISMQLHTRKYNLPPFHNKNITLFIYITIFKSCKMFLNCFILVLIWTGDIKH